MNSKNYMAKEIIRPVGATHIAFAPVAEIADVKFTRMERLVMNTLIKAFQFEKNLMVLNPEDLTSDEICVPDDFLCGEVGWDKSNNFRDLRKVLSKLNTQPICWNILDMDNTSNWDDVSVGEKTSSYDYAQCTFIQGFRRSGSKTYFRFNEIMLEQIKRPKLYAKIDLVAQLNMSSSHSMILYEIFECEFGMNKSNSLETMSFSLPDLKRLLGLPVDAYLQFKAFNRDVLKPATVEISKFSGIDVDFPIPVKQGRSTVAVKFKISKKFQHSLLDNQGCLEMGADEWAAILANLGVTSKTIEYLHGKYENSDNSFSFNAQALKNYSQKNKIDNPDAIAKKAFAGAWGKELKSKFDKEAAQANLFKRREELSKVISGLKSNLSDYESKHRDYVAECYLSHFNALSEDKKAMLKNLFKENELPNSIFAKEWANLDFTDRANHALHACWWNYLTSTLNDVSYASLEDYWLSKNVDLDLIRKDILRYQNSKLKHTG